MIVQLGHVALTVEDGREIEMLRDLRYEEAFSRRQIPNSSSNRESMASGLTNTPSRCMIAWGLSP